MLYICLYFFPNRSFYNYLDLQVDTFDPNKHKLTEIEKDHFLLPGPKSIWAVRTSTGLDFYIIFKDASSFNDNTLFSIEIDSSQNIRTENANTKIQATSIIDAVKEDDFEQIISLLESGEDINQLDNFGRTLLVHAKNQVMLEFLINQGLDINLKNKKGQTPIFNANNKASVTTLLKNGADPESKDKMGNTPIITITNHEAALALMDHGVDVFVKRHDGVPLISLPFKLQYPDIVTILLEKGIDPNIRDKQKRTPIHFAAGLVSTGSDFDKRKNNTIDLLLEYGSDINALDSEGRTPLDYAPPVEIYKSVREHLKLRGGKNQNPRY